MDLTNFLTGDSEDSLPGSPSQGEVRTGIQWPQIWSCHQPLWCQCLNMLFEEYINRAHLPFTQRNPLTCSVFDAGPVWRKYPVVSCLFLKDNNRHVLFRTILSNISWSIVGSKTSNPVFPSYKDDEFTTPEAISVMLVNQYASKRRSMVWREAFNC